MINTPFIKTTAPKRSSRDSREEFVDFVKNQFKTLIKKNLSIPVTLYHL